MTGHKWTTAQRKRFTKTMRQKSKPTLVAREEAERLEDRRRLGIEKEKRLIAEGALHQLNREIDVTSWRHEQRPPHIYIQVKEKLVRYTLRSLEVYVPEGQKL